MTSYLILIVLGRIEINLRLAIRLGLKNINRTR